MSDSYREFEFHIVGRLHLHEGADQDEDAKREVAKVVRQMDNWSPTPGVLFTEVSYHVEGARPYEEEGAQVSLLGGDVNVPHPWDQGSWIFPEDHPLRAMEEAAKQQNTPEIRRLMQQLEHIPKAIEP